MRNCASGRITTGTSHCPIDTAKIIGALVVPHGTKIESETVSLTASSLRTACHASASSRVFGIKPFVEFAQEGGEANVSAVGYGGNKVTGFSALTFKFTTDAFYQSLVSGLMKDVNGNYDVYFYDKDNNIHGMSDDTDYLAGIPLSSIYPIATPFPTSSDVATLQVAFAVKDSEEYLSNINSKNYDFDVDDSVYPLTPVKLVSVTGGYKVAEIIGDLDVTDEFATMAGSNLATCIGATSASYENGIIIASGSNLAIAAASTLASSGVYGFTNGSNS